MSSLFNSIIDTIDPARPHTTTTGAIVDTIDPAQDHVTTTSGATSSLNGLGSGLSGFGAPTGGMASNPNVPAPGSSIDPSTGLPHTAGLTRAELDARKAATTGGAQSSGLLGGLGSSSAVPAPGSSIDPGTGLPHTAGVTRAELDAIKSKGQGLLDNPLGAYPVHHPEADMSGREQAAAQLVGGGLPTTGATSTAGTGSIIDDIEKTATRLGQRAYEAVPVAVKDMFAEPKGKGVEGSPIKPRRGSAAALFDNVKATATNLATTVQNAVIYDPEAQNPISPSSANKVVPSPGPHSGLKDASIPPATNLSVREELNPNQRGSIIDTVTQQAKKISADVSNAVQNAVIYDPDHYNNVPSSGNIPTTAGPHSGLKDGSIAPITNLNVTRDDIKGNRRGSIIDTVTQQAKKISADVQQAMESGRYDITGSSVKTPTTATSTTSTESGGVLASVKTFISDAFQAAPDSPANTYGAGPAQRYAFGTVPLAPRSTVTTPVVATSGTVPHAFENQIARPGEVSGVAGTGGNHSLSTPDHLNPSKSSHSHSTDRSPNPTSTPGEVKIGDDLYGKQVYSGDTPTRGNESSSASAPSAPSEVKIGDDLYGKEVYSADSINHSAPTPSTTTDHVTPSTSTHTNDRSTESSHPISTGSYGLAAALPATVIGAGAAHGATKVTAVPGIQAPGVETAPTPAASALQSSPSDGLTSSSAGIPSSSEVAHTSSAGLPSSSEGVHNSPLDALHPSTATRGGVDRQQSLASVTAIRHGTEGSRNHESDIEPLATIQSGESDEKVHASSVGSTGVTGSTIGSSTPATSTSTSTPTKSAVSPAPVVATPTKSTAATTSTPTKSTLAVPTTPQSTSAHARTGSAGSTGKKVGFMQKLKGEAKIISGKLKNDDAKVKLGEKIKHGEA